MKVKGRDPWAMCGCSRGAGGVVQHEVDWGMEIGGADGDIKSNNQDGSSAHSGTMYIEGSQVMRVMRQGVSGRSRTLRTRCHQLQLHGGRSV